MKKINRITSFKSALLFIVIIWQTSIFATVLPESSAKNTVNQIEEIVMPDVSESVKTTLTKLIQIKVVKLTDNSGLTYIGGKVSAADLELYLSQMKSILGKDFSLYRQYQSTRDHQTFHMTLINPYEYQALTQDVTTGTTLSISLSGLGRVNQQAKATYFVVAQSSQADNYRQKLALTKKDFHVTLGFYPSDIFGVDKGVGSLIKEQG